MRLENTPEGSVVSWLSLISKVNKKKKEGMIMKWKNMEGCEGREINEDGRGKGGKTVTIKG